MTTFSPSTATVDILLIEDDEPVRHLLTSALQQSGYSVHGAANGRAALRLEAKHTFRLVITDLFMPEMDGLEVIMNHNRQRPEVPLLAMTGGYHYSGAEDTLKMASVLGSHATIKKPFELADFLATVRSLIGPLVEDSVSHSSHLS